MEVLHSNYGDVSVDTNARTIHLTTTTGSGTAISFDATIEPHFMVRHGLWINFLYTNLPPRDNPLRANFFYSITHFQGPSYDLQRDVENMLASAGFPLECAPAMYFFLTFTTGVVTTERWSSAFLKVKVGSQIVDVGVEMRSHHKQKVVTSTMYLGAETLSYDKKAASMIREEECVICFERFIDGIEVGRLQCSHTYHDKCLQQWLIRKLSCPFCRAPVYRNT